MLVDVAAAPSDRPPLDACGVNVITAKLQKNPCQWTRRWPGQHNARLQVKQTLMTGAVNHALLHIGYHRAGQVRAFLAVSDQPSAIGIPFARANENAVVVLVRIVKDHDLSDREFGQRRDAPDLWPPS